MGRQCMIEAYFAAIAVAQDYHQLRMVAESVLEAMNRPVGMVCGSYSIGGLGSVEQK